MSAKMLMHPKVVILGYLSAPCVYIGRQRDTERYEERQRETEIELKM